MQHEGESPLPHFVGQYRRHVGIGIAGMDHERQTGIARGGNVGAKPLRLRVARGFVVEVIEASLADRNDLGMAGEFFKITYSYVQFLMRIMRMRAD